MSPTDLFVYLTGARAMSDDVYHDGGTCVCGYSSVTLTSSSESEIRTSQSLSTIQYSKIFTTFSSTLDDTRACRFPYRRCELSFSAGSSSGAPLLTFSTVDIR